MGPQYKYGGYFERDSVGDAQRVLDEFHDGTATVLGISYRGHIVVRSPNVKGVNNNNSSGFINQATDVFLIKGSANVSIVPTSPLWNP